MLLGSYSNELRANVHIKTCIWIFIAALYITVKNWDATMISFNRRMDQQTTVPLCNGVLFSDKKKWGIKLPKDKGEP